MNAHQILDAAKEGLDLSFLEITKALFETGDLVDKSDKYWLQRESTEVLLNNQQGMTSWALAKAVGVDPNVMRQSLMRNKQAYIHSWIHGKSGQPAALYKAVEQGVKAPKDAPAECSIQNRDRRLKEAGHKPQGLTFWQPVQKAH